MVLPDALAIWVGQALGKRLPERAVKMGAAVIFLAFGLFSLVQGADRTCCELEGLAAFRWKKLSQKSS